MTKLGSPIDATCAPPLLLRPPPLSAHLSGSSASTPLYFCNGKNTVLKHGCEDDFHIWVDSESRATREMCPMLQMAPGWAGLSIEPIYAEIHGP